MLAGVFVFGGEIWHFQIRRWRNLAEAPSNTHSKRSLIRISQVCHRRLVVGKSQHIKGYKHTHTYIWSAICSKIFMVLSLILLALWAKYIHQQEVSSLQKHEILRNSRFFYFFFYSSSWRENCYKYGFFFMD